MNQLLLDLRYGTRVLVKNPGFTAVTLLTLALGIGANTAVFSVVNAVLLQSLPYRDPAQLVMVWTTMVSQGVPISGSAPPDYREWRAQNNVFSEIAAFTVRDFNLAAGRREPERVKGALVTASLFPMLGIQPQTGRNFTPQEEEWGRHQEVLISDALWESRFGRDREIVGKALRLGGESYAVVGVMPKGMPFFDDVPPIDLWVPLAFAPGDFFNTRGNHFLPVVARLKPGMSLDQAQAEMRAIAHRIELQFKENAGYGAKVVSLQEQLVSDYRTALLILLGTVGFVLLVACANVANLLLARAASREKEFAVRIALGAGRGRLIRQLLVESVLLGVVGGSVGLLLAFWGIGGLQTLIPSDLPRFNVIEVDRTVIAFTLGVSLLTAMIFGLVPAFHAAKSDVHHSLKEGGRGSSSGSPGRQRLRGLLVVVELGLALMLLIGAGLLLKSFYLLQQIDPGFNSKNVLTMQIPLPDSKYPQPTGGNLYPAKAISFYDQLVQKVESLPGVERAGVTTILPLGYGAGWGKYLTVESHPAPTSLDQVPIVRFQLSSPGYFRSIGMRLREGRFFTAQDIESAQPVAIINETAARRFFPNANPLGKVIYMSPPASLQPPPPPGSPETPRRVIVGVVADVKDTRLNLPPFPEVYAPYKQCEAEGWFNSLMLAVQTASDPLSFAASIRAQVSSLDSDQPVAEVASLDDLVGRSLSSQRFNALLIGLFAGLALALAVVGIYGVMAYSVAQRTHEIGVRMALGAEPRDVVRLVVGQGLRLTLIGLAIGVAAACGLTRVAESLLFNVSATDPITFVAVSLLLAGIALLACYVPARRATKVDPLVALRYE